MIFEVQGSLFRIKNGSKIGSESHLRRGSPQKASWGPLGALLEASGADKKLAWRPLGAVLERLRSFQDGLTPIDGR